jgi:hypothetical protein
MRFPTTGLPAAKERCGPSSDNDFLTLLFADWLRTRYADKAEESNEFPCRHSNFSRTIRGADAAAVPARISASGITDSNESL